MNGFASSPKTWRIIGVGGCAGESDGWMCVCVCVWLLVDGNEFKLRPDTYLKRRATETRGSCAVDIVIVRDTIGNRKYPQ